MKSVVISVFINFILVSSVLYYIGEYLESSSEKILVLYVVSGILLPIVGIIFNTIFQKKLNIILSNIYISVISALTLVIPIELFKTLDKVVNAQKELNGKSFGDNDSAITLDIDLSFNLSSYIVVVFIWVLIGSILGGIVHKGKRKGTENV